MALVSADNVEIPRSSFDVLRIEDMYIHSKDTGVCGHPWNSIKVSFPGDHIYKVRECAHRVLELVDVTEYLERREPMKYRIDFEMKHYGLISDAWVVVATAVISGIAILAMPTGRSRNK